MKITLRKCSLSFLQLDFSFLLLNESQGTYLAHFSKFYILTAFLDAIFNTGAILCLAEVANTGFLMLQTKTETNTMVFKNK